MGGMGYRAMVIEGAFGIDRLRTVDRERAEPAPGDIVVRMRAATLNYRDALMVTGAYNPRQPLPLVPLSDGVGEIVARGEGVTDLSVGDRVCPLFVQGWMAGEPTKDKLATTLGGPIDGVLREELTLPAKNVVVPPPHLTDVEAAALPCAYLTAWNALIEQGAVAPGQTVLVQGTGGVSVAALQLARSVGARVIVTSSSDAKLERARALGADEVINYRAEAEWGKRAAALTDGRGVDIVVEVGGSGTLAQSLRAVRPGGIVAIIGVLGGATPEIDLRSVLMRNVRLQGVFVGHKEAMLRMVRAIAQTGLRPIIDRSAPWQDAPAALASLASGAHFGKIALTF